MFNQIVNVQNGWLVYIRSLTGYIATDRKKYMDLLVYNYQYKLVYTSGSIRNYVSPTYYYKYGYSLLLNTISEKSFYQGLAFFEYQYAKTGVYTLSIDLKDKSFRPDSITLNAFKSK